MSTASQFAPKVWPLTACSREEIDVSLQLIEGSIPTDIYGHVYLNSPCGTVNAPTPSPQYWPDGAHCDEWGDMLFNGDGMLFRFDLQPGQIHVKSALLRTPCYWADEATKYGTTYFQEGKYFKGYGMARMDLFFGSRNQVNTSVNLFRFDANQPTRVTVNFDAGRPFEVDPVSLQVKTPIGWNKEWRQEMPRILQNTFELIQTSAHPSFDPVTREFFTVCFQKSFETLIFSQKFGTLKDYFSQFVQHEVHQLELQLKNLKLKAEHFVHVLSGFVDHLFKRKEGQVDRTYDLEQKLAEFEQRKKTPAKRGELSMEDRVWLMRWTGGAFESWRLVDAETGEDLVINQTMHQTNFSRDYIILVDSSLKFALDILVNEPFPEFPWLNSALRRITAKTIEPTTPLYVIARKDLVPGQEKVKAKRFVVGLETVHFYVNYENPDDQITIHTAHNCAVCAAEWVRTYDYLAIDPDRPALPNTYGLMACGEMDIGRIGKFVVNGRSAEVVSTSIIQQMGFEDRQQFEQRDFKAHTWSVALTTFRDYVSAERVIPEIRHLYWQCYGLDYRLLTQFIKELYADYENRAISVDDLLHYTKGGIPFCLVRQNTQTMQLEDYYVFKMNQNLRSLQFIPRQREGAGTPADLDPQMDGYILCTLVNGPEQLDGPDEYTREIWLFDAANLKQGPVCRLHHPELNYSFTIHSAWAPDSASYDSGYQIDIEEDYNEVLNTFWDAEHRDWMQTFMNKNVYPHYK